MSLNSVTARVSAGAALALIAALAAGLSMEQPQAAVALAGGVFAAVFVFTLAVTGR